MGGGLETIQELDGDARKLLKDLEFALKQDILAYRDPSGTARTFKGRFQQWSKKVDQAVGFDPYAKQYATSLKTRTRSDMDRMINDAKNVHRSRYLVKGGLTGSYNQAVAGALSTAPGQGMSAINRQLDGAVQKLVFQVIDQKNVPDHVKREIARNLSGWLRKQEPVDDAFLFLQSTLFDVARWLEQRVTITTEIEQTKQEVKQKGKLTHAEAQAADRRVGELAKKRQELDRKIKADITRNQTRTSTYFSFQPKLVLDPAKLFVDRLELNAGIKIQRRDVVVDLGTRISLVDPVLHDRALTLNPYAKVNVGHDFSAGIELQEQFKNGQVHQQVKATLSWRF